LPGLFGFECTKVSREDTQSTKKKAGTIGKADSVVGNACNADFFPEAEG
jgi:hypothetical protein